jgi:hypothetical protein
MNTNGSWGVFPESLRNSKTLREEKTMAPWEAFSKLKICDTSGTWVPLDYYAQGHEDRESFAAGVAAF